MPMVEPREPTPLQRLVKQLVDLDGKTHEGVEAAREGLRNQMREIGYQKGVAPGAIDAQIEALRETRKAQR